MPFILTISDDFHRSDFFYSNTFSISRQFYTTQFFNSDIFAEVGLHIEYLLFSPCYHSVGYLIMKDSDQSPNYLFILTFNTPSEKYFILNMELRTMRDTIVHWKQG